jgi:hypothetical protein
VEFSIGVIFSIFQVWFKYLVRVYSGNLKGRDHSAYLGIVGRIILKHLEEVECEIVDWSHLAQDRILCWAHKNTIISILVP